MKSIKEKSKLTKGFTLVEIMVASSLFLSVMLIVSGAILSVFDSNQKSKNLRSVMDNLNLTMESMTRTIRFGTNYHSHGCSAPADLTVPWDCNTANSSLSVRSEAGPTVTYTLSGGRIMRGASNITSPDVTITTLSFWVLGSTPYCVSSCGTQNTSQPKVIILVSGYVGTKQTTRSTFTLQTSISQRVFDFRQ